MTYYNCAKFYCRSIYSFEVSAGGGGGGDFKMTSSLGTNFSEKTLGF